MDENKTATSEGSKGSLIGSIIVVLILIIGAVYFFRQPITSNNGGNGETQVVTTPRATSTSVIDVDITASTTLAQ
jgi:flagellar biogenesis protein FliO